MRDPRFDRAYWKVQEKPPTAEELAHVQAHVRVLAQTAPDKRTFHDLFQWQRHTRSALVREFESMFAEALQPGTQARTIWLDALRTYIDEEVQTYRTNPWFVQYLAAWSEQQNPFRVWDPRFSQPIRALHYRADFADRTVSDQFFFCVDLLGDLDRHLWFETLDHFPLPNFAYTALWEWTDIAYERVQIEECLRLAPVVLSSEGEWLPPHRVATLLLLDMIVSHANLLWDCVDRHQQTPRLEPAAGNDEDAPSVSNAIVDELTPLTQDELPNWMRSVFRMVLERADGQALLIGYLAHVGEGPAMSRRQNPRWDAHDCARSILAEELGLRGTSVKKVRTVWHRSGASAPEQTKDALVSTSTIRRFSANEGEGARGLSVKGGSFLCAAARIVEKTRPLENEIAELWHFFEERIIARDQMFWFFALREETVSVLFGGLFSRLPEPSQAIRRLYTHLEPQRRRAMYWLRYDNDNDAEEPSQFLIHVGLHACANKETWTQTKARHELFWWLYDAARRLWLTSRTTWSSDRDPERLLVAKFFAFMPAVFGNNLNDALPRALMPIRTDAWLVSMAGAFLWRNGIEPAEVMRLFLNAGVNLRAALRDTHQWVSISESRQGRVDPSRSEFPPIARELAQALNLVFETDLPLPQSRSLQNEFRSASPWGAALWDSLERDGFAKIRVHLLAAQTWLLQTTVPETLRERFGLSPDIRILAVQGQLVGRDVRLALAKPIDAHAVDPDLLVVACDHPDFAQRLVKRIPGPFGQRIPWTPSPENEFPPLGEMFREYAGKLDLFEYRDPVHGNALIGRHHEIDELTQRLLRGEAVGVFGLRKVGKSSMMEAVAERLDPMGARLGMFRFYGTEPPEHSAPAALVVSFDAQSVGAKSLSNLVQRLIEYLDERLKWAGLSNEADDRIRNDDQLERFRHKLGMALDRLSLPICFMIDEYDLLFAGYDGAGGLPGIEQFFALLRAEANRSRRVSLALVGRDPAFVDEAHLGGVTNPLLGWVHHHYLGPLRRNEADELLVRLGKRVGLEVGTGSIDLGWQLTGGHPLLLRQFGSILFELAHSPGSRPRPIPTDPVCMHAIDIFPTRNAVRTIVGEIETLLAVRFAASLTLLRALASGDTNRVVDDHGGMNSRALHVLLHFGIVQIQDGRVWVPEIYRHEFAVDSPRGVQEVAGEEE